MIKVNILIKLVLIILRNNRKTAIGNFSRDLFALFVHNIKFYYKIKYKLFVIKLQSINLKISRV